MMVLDACPLARLMPDDHAMYTCSLEYTIKAHDISIIGLLTVYNTFTLMELLTQPQVHASMVYHDHDLSRLPVEIL